MKKYLCQIVLIGMLLCGSFTTPAFACPMCKQANETSDALPRAYMYSIFFMMATPATILTGFSVAFYRLSKKQAELELEYSDPLESMIES